MKYGILNNGDVLEIKYWLAFMADQFPAYEVYWYHKIVPLTNRPRNIHFLKSAELEERGIDPEEVCKAQLHYTTFKHLVRTFEIISELKISSQVWDEVSVLGEGFYHLCAAQDVAFEFLQRCYFPGKYAVWKPKKEGKGVSEGSYEARRDYLKSNSYPLKDLRDYRNHLTHGQMVPSIGFKDGRVKVPKIGRELAHIDWRVISDGYDIEDVLKDFDFVDNILEEAFMKTNSYLNDEWIKYLKSVNLE